MDLVLLLIVVGTIYFLPTIIAACRSHHQAGAIFILNLFLGWTLLGWIGALVWSATAVKYLAGGYVTENVPAPGDAKRKERFSQGLTPMTAEDIAEAIFWSCTLPRNVNINRIQMMPITQAFSPFARSGGATPVH